MKTMDKVIGTLLLVNQVFLVLSQSVQSNYVDETFTIVCRNDGYAFSEMNKTVNVKSAIECARECIHMAPSIGGVCEGINICDTILDPACELIFTPANGIGEVYVVSRPGCLFYGRNNGNIVCSQQEARNETSHNYGSNSSLPISIVDEMSNNTINGSFVDQNNSTMNGTTHQNGTNNVDLWPKGPFTLLQPSSGCPDGWSTGYIQFEMQNPGSSYYSGTYLEGDSVNNLVQWHFCTKTSTDGSPNWPTGSYCILRHGGACPNAFMPGLVAFDEEDNGNQTNRVHHGTLPDLSSWFTDVALYFCCKNDGYNGSTEVTLPVTDPFYLFPYYNRDCQDVADMNKVREFTYFDCEDFSNQNNAAGATPLNVLNSNHNISFCYHYQ